MNTLSLLDTSVIVDMERLPRGVLPDELAICAITLAELAAGPHSTDDGAVRARRQAHLQQIEALFEPIPFDTEAARAYGLIYAATRAARRKPRGGRAVDLLIAAVALSRSIPLITRNPGDFEHLAAIGLVVHAV